MKAAVKKEFAKFLFQRMSKEKAVGLISSFPLLEAQKKILIEVDVLKIPQKQIAWQEGREVKTISRRYNKVLGSVNGLYFKAFGVSRKVEPAAFFMIIVTGTLDMKKVSGVIFINKFSKAFFINSTIMEKRS